MRLFATLTPGSFRNFLYYLALSFQDSSAVSSLVANPSLLALLLEFFSGFPHFEYSLLS